MTVKNDAFTSLFDQAIGTFGDAMKAGVKAQEEIVGWWNNAFDQAGQVQEWNQRSRAMFSEAIPAAQKNVEQWTKLVEQNYQRTLDLLKQTFEAENGNGNGHGHYDISAKTRKLWESSLELFRENTQAMAQTHMKALDLWSEFVRKVNAAAPAAATAPAVGAPKAAPK